MPRYAVTESGKVYLDHKLIGSIDLATGALSLPEKVLKAKIAVMVIKAEAFDQLMAKRGKPLIEIFAAEAPDPGRAFDRPQEQAPSLLGPESRDEYASFQPPPEPPMDPRLGDKTPAYMQWLGTYFPEKYRARYKGRKTHLNTGRNPHIGPTGDVPDDHFGYERAEESGPR